jgi:hypothetical protein
MRIAKAAHHSFAQHVLVVNATVILRITIRRSPRRCAFGACEHRAEMHYYNDKRGLVDYDPGSQQLGGIGDC